MKTRLGALIIVSAVAASLATAQAQVKREHLGDFRDWSTFVDTQPDGSKVCYMTSIPKQSQLSERNTKRGEPYVMVAHWPSRGERGVVSIAGGASYRSGADIVLTVGDKSFELYGDDDLAWTYGLDEDARIVSTMKAGVTMTVKAVAARGYSMTDNYSLRGFTAAFNRITSSCG